MCFSRVCALWNRYLRLRTVPAAGVERDPATSAPDDHLIAGPDCAVVGSAKRCARGAGRYPAIRPGIVSAASVKNVGKLISAAPDDHLIARPDCSVGVSSGGRARDACS
jgi:hypothetical protein